MSAPLRKKTQLARLEAEENRFPVPLSMAVRLLFDELQRLGRLGGPTDGIGEAARTHVRRQVRSDVRMVRRQLDPSRCLVCGRGEMASAELVAVKTADPNHLHHVHAGECFDQHCRIEKVRWDEVVEAAAQSLADQLRTEVELRA